MLFYFLTHFRLLFYQIFPSSFKIQCGIHLVQICFKFIFIFTPIIIIWFFLILFIIISIITLLFISIFILFRFSNLIKFFNHFDYKQKQIWKYIIDLFTSFWKENSWQSEKDSTNLILFLKCLPKFHDVIKYLYPIISLCFDLLESLFSIAQ